MIVTRLCGGLGNQLFQYATARMLAKIHETKILLDLGWFENIPNKNTSRHYELDHYQLPVEKLVLESSIQKKMLEIPFFNLIPIKRFGLKVYREKSYCFDKNFYNALDNSYLKGYWQSHLYFTDIRDILVKELQPVTPPSPMDVAIMDMIEDSENSISIHVRRGDYVSLKSASNTHGTCSLDYYRKSINFFAEHVSDPHFFVFSDDINWCRENLRFPHKSTFVSHNNTATAFQDLRLMAHCKHNVIANSSFSWWGAWLNSNDQKIVIAPRNWFNQSSHDTKDLLPLSWVRL
ncbi:alpha-1,2-fucosyltransferase [Pseudogulbenkiania ferrooxidans]|uniref:alpha-1,2-fucosyltransferase n=1 Tax=Pseudogulbenkiania ferrooxidans TaxID=549169 RepID=UPI0009DBEDF7|nr:alpha-1,2-fucosyltransferase [Pseudogulbenkiania ferrooxidans]